MTTSPITYNETAFSAFYDFNNCHQRLKGGSVTILKRTVFDPPLNGIVEYRFEDRVGCDGTCAFLVDVYIDEADNPIEFGVVLELDGQEYHPQSDRPRPLATNSTPKT